MAFNDWYFEDSDNFPNLSVEKMMSAKLLTLIPETQIAGYSRSVIELNQYASGRNNDLFKVYLTKGKSYDFESISFFDPLSIIIYDSDGKGLVFNSEINDKSDIRLSGIYYSRDNIDDWIAPYTGYYYFDANWDPGVYNTYNFFTVYEDLAADTTPPTIAERALELSAKRFSLPQWLADRDDLLS